MEAGPPPLEAQSFIQLNYRKPQQAPLPPRSPGEPGEASEPGERDRIVLTETDLWSDVPFLSYRDFSEKTHPRHLVMMLHASFPHRESEIFFVTCSPFPGPWGLIWGDWSETWTWDQYDSHPSPGNGSKGSAMSNYPVQLFSDGTLELAQFY